MGDPNHEEWDEGRVPEESLDLLEVERLGVHGRCLVREVRKDSLALGLREEFDGLGVCLMLTKIGLHCVGGLSHS